MAQLLLNVWHSDLLTSLIMQTLKCMKRRTKQQVHCRKWRIAAGLAALFTSLSAAAAALPSDNTDVLLIDGKAVPALSDAILQQTHGKGVDTQRVQPTQLSVILWDEAGSNRGGAAGGATGTGNLQTMSLTLNGSGGR